MGASCSSTLAHRQGSNYGKVNVSAEFCPMAVWFYARRD
jgi:hypothetical protein